MTNRTQKWRKYEKDETKFIHTNIYTVHLDEQSKHNKSIWLATLPVPFPLLFLLVYISLSATAVTQTHTTQSHHIRYLTSTRERWPNRTLLWDEKIYLFQSINYLIK